MHMVYKSSHCTLTTHTLLFVNYTSVKLETERKAKPSLGIPDVTDTWSRVEAPRKTDDRLPGMWGQGEAWITKGTRKILELLE